MSISQIRSSISRLQPVLFLVDLSSPEDSHSTSATSLPISQAPYYDVLEAVFSPSDVVDEIGKLSQYAVRYWQIYALLEE